MEYVITAAAKDRVVILQDKDTNKLLSAFKKAFSKVKNDYDFKAYKIRTVKQIIDILKREHSSADFIIFDFKGKEGEIYLEKDGWINLKEFAYMIGQQPLRDKHIHFSGNEILKDKKQVKKFKDIVKAKSISGYKTSKSSLTRSGLTITLVGLYFSSLSYLKYLFNLAVRNLGIVFI